MKFIITSMLLLYFQLYAAGQKPGLFKSWAGNDLEYVKIDSQRVLFEVFGKFPETKRYLIIGDTLRLYDKYTSSRDNYKKEHVKNYDFLIKELTVYNLTLIPIDSNAKEIADDKPFLNYKERRLVKTERLNFEQIKFNTTLCLGTCPDMSIQIDSNKNLLFIGRRNAIKQGFYQGILSESMYQQFIELLKSAELDKLKNWRQRVSDAPEYTIDLKYNGKMKQLKQFHLPSITTELINFLMELPKKVALTESKSPFQINFLAN